jgi:hypothetical protein
VEEMGGKFFLLGPLEEEKFSSIPFPPSLIAVRSTALGRREPIIFSPKILKCFVKKHRFSGTSLLTRSDEFHILATLNWNDVTFLRSAQKDLFPILRFTWV